MLLPKKRINLHLFQELSGKQYSVTDYFQEAVGAYVARAREKIILSFTARN